MRRPLAFLALVFIAGLILAAAPSEMRAVLAPLLAGSAIAWRFLTGLSHRSTTPPVAEIGTWFVIVVWVYLTLPLTVYLLIGQQYTLFNDARLFIIQPSPGEVAEVGWFYVIFLASFAIAYIATRKQPPDTVASRVVCSTETLAIVAVAWAALAMIAWVMLPSRAADTYAGTYAQFANLPLAMRQTIKLVEGWEVILTTALLVWLFRHYKYSKWFIAAWLTFSLVHAATSPGSRRGLAISVTSCFVLYNIFVRKLKLRTAAGFTILGVLVFLGLGVLRDYHDKRDTGQYELGLTGGEFEALFANGIDLQDRKSEGALPHLPLTFHFADLLAVIPSQLLPVAKMDPSDWYERTFFPEYAEQGYGSAFGVIAQGIVGLGWIEVMLRGVLLGVAYGALHKYYARNNHRYWVVVFYVWMIVWAYQSFRNLSFVMLSYSLQQFVPMVFLVEAVRGLISGPKSSRVLRTWQSAQEVSGV